MIAYRPLHPFVPVSATRALQIAHWSRTRAIPICDPSHRIGAQPADSKRHHPAGEQLYTAAVCFPGATRNRGFVFNRLRFLREVCAGARRHRSVEDIDTVVRDGLGRRWFMGPFETVDLNTRGGIANHAKNMGPSYHRMGLERGDTSVWTTDLVAEVVAQRRQQLDLSDWEDRVSWRDEQLLARIAQQHAGTKESL